MNPVFDVLEEFAEDLVQLSVNFALVGGLAVSVRAVPRFTHDVDVAVQVSGDCHAEQLIHALIGRGYHCETVIEQKQAERLATCRLKPRRSADGILTDVIFATCGIESEITGAATDAALESGVVVPVAQVADLLAMKLLSTAEHRYQDEQDIIELLRVAEADDVEQTRSRLRLITDRGFHRGRSLLDDLDERIARCGWPDGLKNEEFQG